MKGLDKEIELIVNFYAKKEDKEGLRAALKSLIKKSKTVTK
jgi:hypothetical protein